ncbi:protein rexA [Salmonella enterica subsp. enterica]|nr:protein rexA [Salmonella enterica subsp. enterica]
MKVGFYAAYTETRLNKKEKFSINMLKFLMEKSKNDNNLNYGVEYLYVHKINNKTFLFTKTKDKNLIKKINKSKQSVEDIKKSLAADEVLGFPSFIYINKNTIGFCRTTYGPTIHDLIIFLIEKGLNISEDSKITLEPIMRSTTKEDVMKMYYIGRTTVKVEAGTGIFNGILNFLGAKEIEGELFDSLEVIIKPKYKRDIKNLTQDIVNNDENLSDISMRAKEEAGDILTDHYLSEKGHISSEIEKSTNEDIANEMHSCFTRMKGDINRNLKRQIGVIHRQDNT